MAAAGTARDAGTGVVRSDVPARMDRLPWSRFHLLLVVALGITWVLDGLEVTIVGAIGPVLQDKRALGLTLQQIGASASFYVVGAVVGALVFGWLTDRFGRRLVFYATLMIYVGGVIASALAWDFWSFALFRLVTGLGIGGEYAAINSAIDELIPAKYRGRVDLIVNGSFWLGAAAGAGASLLLLDPNLLDPDFGWRLGFGIGGVLGLGILFLRRYVPESPRWLVTHGREDEAERTVAEIERKVEAETGQKLPKAEGILEVHPKKSFGFGEIFSSMVHKHRGRSILALVLMIAQAFLFNAVFFTYGLVLAKFYGVPENKAGVFLVPLAIGNFWARCCSATSSTRSPAPDDRRHLRPEWPAADGDGRAFGLDLFTAWTQTFAWIAIFFVASAAASSAYLTASEIFPLETRALAIAVFYALGTGAGGVMAPWLFTHLIESGQHWALAGGMPGRPCCS